MDWLHIFLYLLFSKNKGFSKACGFNHIFGLLFSFATSRRMKIRLRIANENFCIKSAQPIRASVFADNRKPQKGRYRFTLYLPFTFHEHRKNNFPKTDSWFVFLGFSILVLDLCSTKYSDDVENEDFSIKSVCPTASEFLHNRKNRRGNIASPVFSIPSFVLCSTKYSDENERRNFC